jgi:hypothetical protein
VKISFSIPSFPVTSFQEFINMPSPRHSIAPLKSYLSVLGFISITALTAHPAAANPTIRSEGSMNVARGVVSLPIDGVGTVNGFSAVIVTEISSPNIITDATFGGDISFTESGAQGFANLSITSRPNPMAIDNGDLRPQAIPELNNFDVLTKDGLDRYVSMLKAAAGSDGLEDSTSEL